MYVTHFLLIVVNILVSRPSYALLRVSCRIRIRLCHHLRYLFDVVGSTPTLSCLSVPPVSLRVVAGTFWQLLRGVFPGVNAAEDPSWSITINDITPRLPNIRSSALFFKLKNIYTEIPAKCDCMCAYVIELPGEP